MPIRGYRFVANDIFPVYMPRSGLSYHTNWFAPNGAMPIFALLYYKAAALNRSILPVYTSKKDVS